MSPHLPATWTGGRAGSPVSLYPKSRLFLVFNRVYRLEIQSVILVFRPLLWTVAPLPSLWPAPPLPPSQSKRTVLHTQSVCGCGVGGVELCGRSYSAGGYTLFLTSFRTYKISTPPQTKTLVTTTFRFDVFIIPSSMQFAKGFSTP